MRQMKKKKILRRSDLFSDSYFNAYPHCSDCTFVNEFSLITVGELNEAVTSNFLNKFHVINVHLMSLPEDLELTVNKFVDFAKSTFSAVLIQSYLLSSCNISLLVNRSQSIKSAIFWLDKYVREHNVCLNY